MKIGKYFLKQYPTRTQARKAQKLFKFRINKLRKKINARKRKVS